MCVCGPALPGSNISSLTCLTHGHLQSFPGQSFSSLVTERTQALRDIGRKLEKSKMQNCM